MKKRQATHMCFLVAFVSVKNRSGKHLGPQRCVSMCVNACVAVHLGGSLCGLGDESGVSPSRLTRI